MNNKVIIIGDATNNTLSAVRSFGEAGIPQFLILVAEDDPLFVRKSKYLRAGNLQWVKAFVECEAVIECLKATDQGATLMTTFDAAAQWLDERESEFSKLFRTPCRGKQLGRLFDKEAQCELAKRCGLTVPLTMVHHRGQNLPRVLPYPIITKPLVSSEGEKEDIHICLDEDALRQALSLQSRCRDFVIQEFVDKEFEINCIGVRTESGIVMGAIRKIRHYPSLTGTATFAHIERVCNYGIDTKGVSAFLQQAGYYGPFSVEFLHKDNKNYFMEVNLRNDGLAYTATAAGMNLHALYMQPDKEVDWSKFHPVYMMNYSIDLLHVKEGRVSLWHWVRDLLRTRCFINMCISDLGPTLAYYRHKIFRK